MLEAVPGMNLLLAPLELVMELELVDEPKCGSNHGAFITPEMEKFAPPGLPPNFPCSIKVVARKTTCVDDFFICQVSYDWNTALMQHIARPCPYCGAPGFSCWSIYPI